METADGLPAVGTADGRPAVETVDGRPVVEVGEVGTKFFQTHSPAGTETPNMRKSIDQTARRHRVNSKIIGRMPNDSAK